MDAPLLEFREEDWVDPELREFFSSVEARKKLGDLAERRQLEAKQSETLFAVVHDVALGKIGNDEVARAMIGRAGLPPKAALELQGDLYAEIFSGVDELLESQYGVYRDLHPEEFLPPPPPEIDLTEDIAKEAIKKTGILPPDPVLARRLVTVVVSCLKDIRDEAETKVMLEKPIKTGGMGFAPEKSAALLLALAEAKPKFQVAKETAAQKERARTEQQRALREQKEKKFREIAARFGKAAPAAPAETLAAPKEKKEDLALEQTTAKEREEIKNIGDKAVKREAFEDTVRMSAGLDAAVDDAVAASGQAPTDEDLKRRFRLLVSLYFRDLRDGLETRSKFTMPVVSGGMGMADADADRVMSALKDKSAAFHAGAYDKKAEEKAKYVEERQAKVMTGDSNEQRKEQDALDRAYADLLGRGGAAPPTTAQPSASTPAEPAKPRVIPVIAAGGTPIAVIAPKQPMGTVPIAAMPAAPTSASVREPKGTVPIAAVTAPAVPKPTAAPPANLPVAPPLSQAAAKPAATLSASVREPRGTVPIAAPPSSPVHVVGQPTVSDVKFTPRLTGPVEELRQLTLKDFRRLSKDPREATLKIKDKIDLLDDLGFEIKTQGIKAWQDSEVNKLYLSILRGSLEGRPVVEVIQGLEEKREPFLDKQEFDSVMALNRKLRFG